MAAESLILKQPGTSGAEIALTSGSWSVVALDLNNPSERLEYLAGADRDGALPSQVPLLDNREVAVKLRMSPQSSMDAALSLIGSLEDALANARRVAAAGTIDPVDFVRLVWTPADSTKTFFLPIYGGRITGLPKVLEGEDAGYFSRSPILELSFECDPYGYGTFSSSGYLSTTLTGSVEAQSFTVAGGAGDAPPWIKVTIADTASRMRNRVLLGLKQDESSTTPFIAASSMTLLAGTLSSGYLITSTTDDVIAASIPRQTRTGRFRVYALGAGKSGVGSSASLGISWQEVGSSRRDLPSVSVPATGDTDVFLGEVNAAASWDLWIRGSALKVSSLLLLPADQVIDAVGPGAGENLVASVVAEDALDLASTHITGRTFSGGTWSTSGTNVAASTWPVVASAPIGARRTVLSNAAAGFAVAGTTNKLDVQVAGRLAITGSTQTQSADRPILGIFARYADISNFIVAGLRVSGNSVIPGVWACVANTYTSLWQGPSFAHFSISTGLGREFGATLQATRDGRWWASFSRPDNGADLTTGGTFAPLVEGNALGGTTNRFGLFDYASSSTASTRAIQAFLVRDVVGLTPPPLQSGGSLVLAGSNLLASGAEYPYAGAPGLRLKQGTNNNLTVLTRRGLTSAQDRASNLNDSGTITVGGYPRFLTVPH